MNPGSMRRMHTVVGVTITLFSLSVAPCNAESAYERGVRLYRNGQFNAAAIQFELHAKAHPKDANALYFAALSYHQLREIKKAEYLYRQSIAIAPKTDAARLSNEALAKLATLPPSPPPSTRGETEHVPTQAFGTNAEFYSLPSEARVYFHLDQGQMVVNGFLNGRPLQMIFDTGAPMMAIGKDQLAGLGLGVPKGVAAGKTGGSSNAKKMGYWIMAGDVKVGQIDRKNVQIQVLEENATQALLGQNFFQDFTYTVDSGAKCIHFKKRTFEKHATATSQKDPYTVPFDWEPAGRRIVVTAEVNGKKCSMLFDTGNSSTNVTFACPEDLKKACLAVPEDAKERKTLGVSGEGVALFFPVSCVRLGPIEKRNVEIEVNKEGIAGHPYMGQQFWAGWEYTIDMDRRLIHFRRR